MSKILRRSKLKFGKICAVFKYGPQKFAENFADCIWSVVWQFDTVLSGSLFKKATKVCENPKFGILNKKYVYALSLGVHTNLCDSMAICVRRTSSGFGVEDV